MIETIFIPLKIIKRGGYKGQVLSQKYSAEKTELNEALIRALLKAYLWEKIIYDQFDGNLDIFCQKNKFSKRYVQKILKLNLLSPKIVEPIMSGNHPKNLSLDNLIRNPIPAAWKEQEKQLNL